MKKLFIFMLLLGSFTPAICQAVLPGIFATIKGGDMDAIKLIVEQHPESVNFTNDVGKTPLIIAATAGNIDLVRLLLTHKASPALRDAEGKLAIDYATENKYDEVISLLEHVISVPNADTYLAAFKQDGKWGFIDLAGRIRLEAKWTGTLINEGNENEKEIPHFSEGLAAVKGREQWGFIDLTGKWVIKPQYDDLGEFYKGVAPFELDDKWGLLDATGNEVCPAKYGKITDFRDNITMAEGTIIDLQGKELINDLDSGIFKNFEGDKYAIVVRYILDPYNYVPATFIVQDGDKFNEFNVQVIRENIGGVYIVRFNKGYGLFSKNDMTFATCIYKDINYIGDGLYAATTSNDIDVKDTITIINSKGEVILGTEYHSVSEIGDNIFWGKDDLNRYNAMNIRGIQVLPPRRFQDVKPWSQGIAPVKIDGSWQYIDLQWNQIGTNNYDDADPFSNNRAAVLIGGKWGYIDPQGKLVIPCDFNGKKLDNAERSRAGEELSYLAPNGTPQLKEMNRYDYNGHVLVLINNKWSVIDQDGKTIIPATIDLIKWVAKDRVALLIDGHWGLYDDKYNAIITADNGFQRIDDYDSLGLAHVVINDGKSYGFINRDGVLVIQTQGQGLANYHDATAKHHDEIAEDTDFGSNVMTFLSNEIKNTTASHLVVPQKSQDLIASHGVAFFGSERDKDSLVKLDCSNIALIDNMFNNPDKYSSGIYCTSSIHDEIKIQQMNIVPIDNTDKYIEIQSFASSHDIIDKDGNNNLDHKSDHLIEIFYFGPKTDAFTVGNIVDIAGVPVGVTDVLDVNNNKMRALVFIAGNCYLPVVNVSNDVNGLKTDTAALEKDPITGLNADEAITLGTEKFHDLYLTKTNNETTPGECEAYDKYAELYRFINDRAALKLSSDQQTIIKKARIICSYIMEDYVDIDEACAGGGTIHQIELASGMIDVESSLYKVILSIGQPKFDSQERSKAVNIINTLVANIKSLPKASTDMPDVDWKQERIDAINQLQSALAQLKILLQYFPDSAAIALALFSNQASKVVNN